MAKDFFSVAELENSAYDVMEFKGKWLDAFGRPEKKGVWIIFGETYNGKSSLMMQLAKYLTGFVKNKVLINALEEGKSESLRLNSKRSHLSAVEDKILFGNRVPIDKLSERLKKQRSPEIIFIDSLQYTNLDKLAFIKLIEDFPNKLWIFISHADGKIPRGSVARHIENDAAVKIRVEGFKAFVKSRYGGGKPYTINPELAANYHGEIK